jgi:hypothetical protein
MKKTVLLGSALLLGIAGYSQKISFGFIRRGLIIFMQRKTVNNYDVKSHIKTFGIAFGYMINSNKYKK